MKEFVPTTQTVTFVLIFLVIYMALLLRRVVSNKVDLYDFFMLSTLAIAPALFVTFPGLMNRISVLIGIGFPFFILFGVISAITFLMIYRLIRRANQLKAQLVTVVQELALLKSNTEKQLSESAQKR